MELEDALSLICKYSGCFSPVWIAKKPNYSLEFLLFDFGVLTHIAMAT